MVASAIETDLLRDGMFGDVSGREEAVGSLTFSKKDLVEGVGEVARTYRRPLAIGGALLFAHATTGIALGASPDTEPVFNFGEFIKSSNGQVISLAAWGAVEGLYQGMQSFRLNDAAIKERGGKGMPGKYALTMPLQAILRESGTNGMMMTAVNKVIGAEIDPGLFLGLTAAMVVTEGFDIADIVSTPIRWLHK